MQKLLKLMFHRVTVVVIALIIQIVVFAVAFEAFYEHFVQFYGFCILLSVLVVLWVINSESDPGYKIAWIVPIMTFPIFGGIVYLVLRSDRLSRRERREIEGLWQEMTGALSGDCKAESLMELSEDAVIQARYLERSAMCPVYSNTESRYFPLGELKFQAMLEELKKAQKYIFMEYFIIEQGEMWDSILTILMERARAGVEVRVMYDDMGCLFTLPKDYAAQLEEEEIHCVAFNRLMPVLSMRANNRNHQKVCIIDGKVAFTGGINLADEYINTKVKYGHWKDGGVLLRGEAVWSMTVMFLAMWHLYRDQDEALDWFHPDKLPLPAEPGYVQPYMDSPLDNESVAQTVYLNLINRAKHYIYITTPYLIINHVMTTALTTAAKSGVDVRIMTPRIPDKKLVFEITQAHYEALLEAGVQIYEYTPGFLHAKTFVVDDMYGVCGTVNMDYRSFFLHFENAVLLYGQPAIGEIRNDFLQTQEICQRVTLKQCRDISWIRKLWRSVIRVLAPWM